MDTKKTCGAKTRAGTPCQRRDLLRGGRCRLHGGLSTGPKTLAGKRRSALNTGKTYEELISSRAKSKNLRKFFDRSARVRKAREDYFLSRFK